MSHIASQQRSAVISIPDICGVGGDGNGDDGGGGGGGGGVCVWGGGGIRIRALWTAVAVLNLSPSPHPPTSSANSLVRATIITYGLCPVGKLNLAHGPARGR